MGLGEQVRGGTRQLGEKQRRAEELETEKESFQAEQKRSFHFGSRYDFHMLHVSHFGLFYSIFLLIFWIQLGA